MQVKKLSCAVENRLILDEISFSVKRGEYVMIVGSNGVGKTTLLRCLNRMIDRWTGEIFLNGTPLRRFSRRELAQRVAIVFQTNVDFFSFSVRQWVELGRYPFLNRLAPMSQKDVDEVNRALALMQIENLSERLLETLSGGERQKVFLAAAIAQHPEFLLLDEPTTFLDYQYQKEISLLLKRLNREEGTTIIEVTHDLNHAVLNGDHFLALQKGALAFDGSAQELMCPDVLQKIFATSMRLAPHPDRNIPMVLP